MNRSLPLVAIEVQKEMRSNSELKQRYKEILKEVTLIFDKTEQLNFVRQQIDSLNNKIKPEDVTCKKGCSFCCYHEISSSLSELKSIRSELTTEQLEKFNYQSIFETWNSIDYEKRSCPILINNECSKYNNRPLICRVTHVSTPSENCIEENGKGISHNVSKEVSLYLLAYYSFNENFPLRDINQLT